ncbi:hypothetical protein MPSEU_000113700 [Mayamaea pseudoterrestris]|nr:hypothetical protein MPSEU_000113700 [Mayamaea pseudoterrestris]
MVGVDDDKERKEKKASKANKKKKATSSNKKSKVTNEQDSAAAIIQSTTTNTTEEEPSPPPPAKRRKASWFDKMSNSNASQGLARMLIGKLCLTLSAVGVAGLQAGHLETATLILDALLVLVGDAGKANTGGRTAAAATGDATVTNETEMTMRAYWEQHVAPGLRNRDPVVCEMEIEWTAERMVWEQMLAVPSQGKEIQQMEALASDAVSEVAAASPGNLGTKRTRRSKTTPAGDDDTVDPGTSGGEDQQSPYTSHWVDVAVAHGQLFDKKLDGARVEGRLAIKRWPVAAIAWGLQGQAALLQGAMDAENVGLACHLLTLFAQISQSAGAKPAVGVDAFCRALTGQKKAARVEGNLKDYLMVSIYAILEKHSVVVRKEVGAEGLINLQHGVVHGAGAYPFVADAINDCITAVAVSEVGSPAERTEWSNRLACASAAYILHFGMEDIHLLRYAIEKLKGCLKMGEAVNSSDWNVSKGGLKLEDPLPVPTLPSIAKANRGTLKKKSQPEGASLAGVFDERPIGVSKQDELLALFYRAMNMQRSSAAFDSLLTHFIGIAEKCLGVFNEFAKKRTEKFTNDLRKNKRRKKNDGREEAVDVTGCLQRSDTSGIQPEKLSLAAEIFAVLELCLARKNDDARMNLRHYLRSLLSNEDIFHVIDLCSPIIVWMGRDRHKSDVACCDGAADNENCFWDSYVNLCVCVGRGLSEVGSSDQVTLRETRMAIFKKIARTDSRTPNTGWPLWLPVPLRRLVAASLAADCISTEDTAVAPDLYIAQGFVDSIAAALPRSTSSKFFELKVTSSVPLKENVTLSLSNARLFVAAVVRLPPKQRVQVLKTLLDALHSSLGEKEDWSKNDEFDAGTEFSCFLARLISITTNLVVILTCSESLSTKILPLLRREVDSTVTMRQSCMKKDQAEKCFVSVLDDSEMFDIDIEDCHVQYSRMDEGSCKQFQSILERAFSFGFRCAAADKCCLLYASWHSLGMSDLWCKNTSTIRFPVSIHDPGVELPLLINELRFEIRHVHRRIQQGYGLAKTIPLSRVVSKKDSERMTQKSVLSLAAKEVRLMVSKASMLITEIMEQPGYATLAETQALLETLCTYITFAIASCTRPSSDFLSYLQLKLGGMGSRGRERAYSSEDDALSDDESASYQNGGSAAVDRLQYVCTALNSVPAYPDWLDTSCTILESFVYGDVAELAVTALNSLSDLINVGRQSVREAITQNLGSPVSPTVTNLIQSLMAFKAHGPDGDETRPSMSKALACLCSIGKGKMDSIFIDKLVDELDQMEMHWTAQALRKKGLESTQKGGRLRSAHFRATDEWEGLLVVALSVSGVKADSVTRWFGVSRSALDALIPASALLRFGLMQGGRQDHPLKLPHAPVAEFDMMTFIADTSTGATAGTDQQIHVVTKTLASICQLESTGGECEAVAANLINDMRSFATMRGAVNIRLLYDLMATVQSLSSTERAAETFDALRYIFSEIAQQLVLQSSNNLIHRQKILKASLSPESEQVGLIASSIGVSEVIAIATDRALLGSHSGRVKGILSTLWRDSEYITPEARQIFLRTVGLAYGLDNLTAAISGTMMDEIGDSINQCSECALRSVVEDDVYGSNSETRSIVCSLLAVALASAGFTRAIFVRDRLLETYLRERKQQFSLSCAAWSETLSLLCLYSCYCGSLDELTTIIIQSAGGDNSAGLADVETISDFLHALRHETSGDKELLVATNFCEVDAPFTRFRGCTNATLADSDAGDFYQHTYHCYTCGLCDDKECCTPCALVCHAGHDVGYARYGQFLCDCGGNGDESSSTRSAMMCKCLSSLPANELQTRYKEGQARHRKLDRLSCEKASHPCFGLNPKIAAQLAVSCNGNVSKKSLNAVVAVGHRSDWIRVLLGFLRSCTESPTFSMSIEPQGVVRTMNSYNQIRKEEFGRVNELKLPLLPASSATDFERAAFFRPATWQSRISADSSVETLKRALLLSNGSHRSTLSANSRGGIALIESRTVVFCTLTPLLNSCCKPYQNHPLAKSSICVIGNEKLEFDPIGIKYSPFNDRCLIVWGTHEAILMVLDEYRCKVVLTTSLEIALGSLETSTDLVMDCNWVPDFYPCILVRCLHSLFLFELSREAQTLEPATCHKVASTVTFRGVQVVTVDAPEPPKIFILLEAGYLFEFSLRRDENGRLQLPQMSFETSSALQLPSSGSPPSITPKQLCMGEGQQLNFLSQSRLLLYECTQGEVVALKISDEGNVSGYFTLITRVSEGGFSSYPFTSPFTHWTDLGAIKGKECMSFRAACVGQQGTKGRAVLYIKFNHLGFTMKELVCEQRESGFNSPATVEGVAAFSAPSMLVEADAFDLSRSRTMTENIAIAAMMSNGSMHLFVEEIGALSVPYNADGCAVIESETCKSNTLMAPEPLLGFEELENQTDEDETTLHIESSLGSSEEVLKKLHRDNADCLKGAMAGGFCLSLYLKPDAADEATSEQIFAALRILVGSNSKESVPSKIIIQGRELICSPGVKKWYCHQLTAQEVALTMRIGYLPIVFVPVFNSPECTAVDALEVFTTKREHMSGWQPRQLLSLVAAATEDEYNVSTTALGLHPVHDTRALTCLEAFMRFCQIVCPTFDLTLEDKSLFGSIIMRHCLDETNSVIDMFHNILASFSIDEESRLEFIDRSIIQGCLNFMSLCDQKMDFLEHKAAELWPLLHLPLRTCFKAASCIAASRPINYYQSVTEMSPAVKASTLLSRCVGKFLSNASLIPDFIELYLLEIVVANGSGLEDDQRSRLVNFGCLKTLMQSANLSEVVTLCSSVKAFCVKYEDPFETDDDLFAGRKLCYECDSCHQVPMKLMRYSLPDELRPFDLCDQCYRKAYCFADSKSFDACIPVEIEGKLVGDETNLTCADTRLLQPIAIDCATNSDDIDEDIGRRLRFESFIGTLFDAIFTVVCRMLPERGMDAVCERLLRLAADVNRCSKEESNKVTRASRVGQLLAQQLSHNLRESQVEPRFLNTPSISSRMVVLLRAMANLITIDFGARGYLLKSEDYVDDLFAGEGTYLCHHGIPAVGKRFTTGKHKNRAFLSCAKDSKFCCNFFAWEGSAEKVDIDKYVAEHLWLHLSALPDSKGLSPLNELCVFVVDCLKKLPDSRVRNTFRFGRHILRNTTIRTSIGDVADGVLASRCRLQDVPIQSSPACLQDDVWLQKSQLDEAEDVVRTVTALLALIAKPDHGAKEDWSPILCELIMTNNRGSSLVEMAKRALGKLCDTDKCLYVSVRTRYTFSFHCERLIAATEDIFREGLHLLERSRRSSNLRRATDSECALNLPGLGGGDLLFAGELLSEDAISMDVRDNVLSILGDMLLAVAKTTKGDHWRQFCSLRNSDGPLFRRSMSAWSTELRNMPPAILLFMLACLSEREIQYKALRLLDLSCSSSKPSPTPNSGTRSLCWEGVETILNLSTHDIYAFATTFICYSTVNEVRKLALKVARKIVTRSDPNLASLVFVPLLESALPLTHEVGKNVVDILNLCQILISETRLDIDTTIAAEYIQSCWMQQMIGLRYDKANQSYLSIEMRTSASCSRKRYELNLCVYCMGSQHKEKNQQATRHPENFRTVNTLSSASNLTALPSTRPSEQLIAYTRGRLEGWRSAVVSDAFNAYSSLKYRLMLSEVHVEVNDPRSRFVKVIKIYFSPRPVADVTQLRNPEYVPVWQECGKIYLGKGASRASVVLEKPVTAANLRIEYAEFYERVGSSKSCDDSSVLYCPRCNRVVNNAHGVCGNCGEVAFQCRKCRKINYDRLDAFLCVECGYCSSAGSLSFELTAAITSNAVAVTNDDDHTRSRKMFAVAQRLHEDLRSLLLEQIAALPRIEAPLVASGKDYLAGPSHKEVETCHLTLSNLGKQGSVLKAVARVDDGEYKTRSQSLRRLTREWRDSATASEGRQLSSILDRLGQDLQLDDDESADELIGLLESGAIGRGHSEDAVNRLLSTVQSRRLRRATAEATAIAGSDPSGAPNTISASTAAKQRLELCDRLYLLMKEAEREAYLLEKRITAWRKLDTGTLVPRCSGERGVDAPFQPSHCSMCSSHVALHLLQLWLTLFESAPEEIKIDPTMIQMLLTERFYTQKNLSDLKRRVIQSIALLSRNGGPEIILDALRVQLRADPDSSQCTEILSRIIDGGGHEDFAKLSMEVLEASSFMELL